MTVSIIVINTRAANIHSVSKALEKVGVEPRVTSDPADLMSADAAVLPGVGAADAAMRALNEAGLTQAVRDYAASGRPLLCVCLGMQVLFEKSDEGRLPGLGVLKGEVRLLPGDMTGPSGERLKVPHMGWNSVRFTPSGRASPVFAGIPDGTHFYFVHSYHCVPDKETDTAAVASYGSEMCAAVVRGNVVGTQFHPEKSGEVGLRVYSNFVKHAAGVAL